MKDLMRPSETDVYYSAVRAALAKGNAAVIVGAGFSRNADGGSALATWPSLAKELALALDPHADVSQFSTGNVTQLAEQYARVFSTPVLEDLLKRAIPDERVAPGALHDALLRLSWSEIFTTNYDTLLERAGDKMFERAHFTVCCREDIPQSKILGRRRIVKLHGSFPSQRPFIFTEEDYRTYPQKFAPFVNLVRQSLLENVCCLIGFSGDDPNFLHWLGWVRDMLDKHALPVYLFLGDMPNLGQRKLLEARGVIPVVLPAAASDDPHDYAGRYHALFRILGAPATDSAAEWGKVALPAGATEYKDDEDDKYAKFLTCLAPFADLRGQYPGWLVAPRAARRKLESAYSRLPHNLEDIWVQRRLAKEAPAFGLAVLSLHVWGHDVLLLPIDDEVARLTMGVLDATRTTRFEGLDALVVAQLKPILITDETSFNRQWRAVGIAMLRWARQGLRELDFRTVCLFIRSRMPHDAELVDMLEYEEILLRIYQGRRSEARKLAGEWRVRDIDPYMRVRKSSLLGELGDVQAGLDLCKQAIQKIREAQQRRPGDLLLISQEAWACLIADRLQNGVRFSNWPLEAPPIAGEEESPDEDWPERMKVLASRGYAAQDELEKLTASLEAEAQPPFAAQYKFDEFDLGATSNTIRFGWSSELRSKVNSGLMWLELAERVGLMVRTPRVSHFADSFLQAGWWTQYGDSFTRVLGVLSRTMSVEAMKPRDGSKPPHKTGWLSRFQVAVVSNEMACETCETSIDQVENAIKEIAGTTRIETELKFQLEQYSRLVLRVKDEARVLSWGLRIARMHEGSQLQSLHTLWGNFSLALARSMEALSSENQLRLLRQVATLPQSPPTPFRPETDSNWIKPFDLLARTKRFQVDESISSSWRPEIDSALNTLEREPTSTAAWRRLFWLDGCGVMSERDKGKVGELLWSDGVLWPIIDGFEVWAALRWPAPAGAGSTAQGLLRWLLSRRLSSPANGPMIAIAPAGRRGWGYPWDDSHLRAWRVALERCEWKDEDLLSLVADIATWWASDAADLLRDAPSLNMLMQSLATRLHLIDEILSDALVAVELRGPGSTREDVRRAIADLRTSLATSGVLMARLDMLAALADPGSRAYVVAQQKLAREFLSDDNDTIGRAARAISWVFAYQGAAEGQFPDSLADAVFAVLSARRLPSLPWALDLLTRTVTSAPRLFTPSRLMSIDTALDLLFEDLKYQHRTQGSGIGDDFVPLLRFKCSQLASQLLSAGMEPTSAARWVAAAEVDPLPELRLSRY